MATRAPGPSFNEECTGPTAQACSTRAEAMGAPVVAALGPFAWEPSRWARRYPCPWHRKRPASEMFHVRKEPTLFFRSVCRKNVESSQKVRDPKLHQNLGFEFAPAFVLVKPATSEFWAAKCARFLHFLEKPFALGGSLVLAVGKFLGVSTAATPTCGACQHGRNVHEDVATTSKRIGAAAARSSKAALLGRGGKS